MCRFTYYIGRPLQLSSLITEPSNSIIHQSFHSHEREEPLNGDGFGVAWYADGHSDPALFKSISPAWNNANLRDIARVTTSHCALIHVRAATQQLEVGETNCHPFRFRNFAFMHNGDIGGFNVVRRKIIERLSEESFRMIRGTTDSEHFFALLIDQLLKENDITCQVMSKCLTNTIKIVLDLTNEFAHNKFHYLNMVLSNGVSSVACRFTTDKKENADSLYYNHGRKYICERNVCKMIDPEGDMKAVLVSSEPLSKDKGWEPVPINHIVSISKDLKVEIKKMEINF